MRGYPHPGKNGASGAPRAQGKVVRLTPPLPGGVLLAVSAGADSMALAVLLAEAAIASSAPLRIAHVDHGLRPDRARLERATVALLADRLGLPLDEVRLTPPPRPASRPPDEEWARRERYAALLALARHHDLALIATGHHAADRRETQLLHLLRGGGLKALRGIAPLRRLAERWLWRPLLEREPAELRALLQARGIAWCEDASNRDLRLARNRLRHRVVPALVQAGDPLYARLDPLAHLAQRVLERFDRSAAAVLHQAVGGARGDLLLMRRSTLSGLLPHALPELLAAATQAVGACAPVRQRRRELAALSRWLQDPRAKGRSSVAPLVWWADGEWRGVESAASADAVAPTLDVPLAGANCFHDRLWRWRCDWQPRASGATANAGSPEVALAPSPSVEATADLPLGPRYTLTTLRIGDHPKRVAAAVPWFERGSWPAIRRDGQLLWLPRVTPPPTAPTSAGALRVTFQSLRQPSRNDAGDALESASPG